MDFGFFGGFREGGRGVLFRWEGGPKYGGVTVQVWWGSVGRLIFGEYLKFQGHRLKKKKKKKKKTTKSLLFFGVFLHSVIFCGWMCCEERIILR